MNHNPNWDTQGSPDKHRQTTEVMGEHPGRLKHQLEEITAQIRTLAQHYEGDLEELLSLLRTLEQLHREIRERFFEPSLPDTRKDLYNLLREIEETGGWPYIERMKLQTFLKALTEDPQLPSEDGKFTIKD